jgi:restriction endonuclease Mrr
MAPLEPGRVSALGFSFGNGTSNRAKIARRFLWPGRYMAIPDYQSLMLPVLKLAGDSDEHRMSDVVDALATQLNLTEAEREELLPSGKQPVFNNRVHWAKTYLAQAKLLISTRRAFFRITERGRSVLAENVERIDAKFLRVCPETSGRIAEFSEHEAD